MPSACEIRWAFSALAILSSLFRNLSSLFLYQFFTLSQTESGCAVLSSVLLQLLLRGGDSFEVDGAEVHGQAVRYSLSLHL